MAQNEEQISQSLKKTLDYHGFSFQYSVIRKAGQLRQSGKTEWEFLGAEIPVMVNNQITHADFVFKHQGTNTFLIGECKRVDPALANWCFVKAPYTFADEDSFEISGLTSENEKRINYTYFDYLRHDGMGPYAEHGCKIAGTTREIFHLGYSIKTTQPGDGSGDRSKDINDTIAQALRSTSGFINSLFKREKLRNLVPNDNYFFIPAIFSTASIWGSDVDLGIASLEDGKLPADSTNIKRENWVWFNHNRSTHLAHSVTERPIDDIHQKYNKEYIRSIAIVGVSGIDEFFGADLSNWIKSFPN